MCDFYIKTPGHVVGFFLSKTVFRDEEPVRMTASTLNIVIKTNQSNLYYFLITQYG